MDRRQPDKLRWRRRAPRWWWRAPVVDERLGTNTVAAIERPAVVISGRLKRETLRRWCAGPMRFGPITILVNQLPYKPKAVDDAAVSKLPGGAKVAANADRALRPSLLEITGNFEDARRVWGPDAAGSPMFDTRLRLDHRTMRSASLYNLPRRYKAALEHLTWCTILQRRIAVNALMLAAADP